jgi:hypothetical protein
MAGAGFGPMCEPAVFIRRGIALTKTAESVVNAGQVMKITLRRSVLQLSSASALQLSSLKVGSDCR